MTKMSFALGSTLEPQIVYGHRFPGEENVFHMALGRMGGRCGLNEDRNGGGTLAIEM
jgi:hypothetical protein